MNAPSGITAELASSTLEPHENTTLTIRASTSTVPGQYSVTVQRQDNPNAAITIRVYVVQPLAPSIVRPCSSEPDNWSVDFISKWTTAIPGQWANYKVTRLDTETVVRDFGSRNQESVDDFDLSPGVEYELEVSEPACGVNSTVKFKTTNSTTCQSYQPAYYPPMDKENVLVNVTVDMTGPVAFIRMKNLTGHINATETLPEVFLQIWLQKEEYPDDGVYLLYNPACPFFTGGDFEYSVFEDGSSNVDNYCPGLGSYRPYQKMSHLKYNITGTWNVYFLLAEPTIPTTIHSWILEFCTYTEPPRIECSPPPPDDDNDHNEEAGATPMSFVVWMFALCILLVLSVF